MDLESFNTAKAFLSDDGTCTFKTYHYDMDEGDEIMNISPHLNSLTTQRGEWQLPAPVSLEDEQRERIDELEAKVKWLEEKCAEEERTRTIAEEELQNEQVKSKRLVDAVNCVVCLDTLWYPQSLECGHTACYPCLKKWWTTSNEEDITAAMINTRQEGSQGMVDIPTTNPLQSVVNRKKECPHCKAHIIRRPAPNYLVRHIVEIINDHLPSHTRELFPPTAGSDPWDGIFHPENVNVVGNLGPNLVPIRLQNPTLILNVNGPDPSSHIGHENPHITLNLNRGLGPLGPEDGEIILHEMAQIATRRTRREVGQALASRQRELDEARLQTQRMVSILEMHQQWREMTRRDRQMGS
ncbi:hypothetical protein Clacol_005150 [Clathrus columnatus]|uniref:RING-type domain-containing protein n=1 Tax=Clathrus columnatus TaxID=1419009 RepID=A0AAV5A8G3_9AGAM|nr:hypothetical protein Clacol_005150 [Clathrus columnatus]